MDGCREAIYSNDYFDFIVAYDELEDVKLPGSCVQRIEENYDTYYYPRAGFPPLNVNTYSYTAIPKCYGLLDQAALEASGILRLQNQPTLSLTGEGVLVGFIDTGIDYVNQVFRLSDGSSRIFRIWDQTIEEGTPPAGFLYGGEYTKEQLNEALQAENPYEVVPSRDENGHGTFLAGVACGSEDIPNNFIGAAPRAEIAVVKLKEAKQYLRDFFFIQDGVPAYQENDIMSGISYLNQLAEAQRMPLVICLALGNNMGSHGKNGPLSTYLNYICSRRKRIGVVPTGNEANSRHHFQGRITANMEYENVEINVERDMDGFFVELWSAAPELFAVSVISPTGERIPKVPSRAGGRQEFTFVFENTTVTIDYRIVGKSSGKQLIYFQFINAKRGIWTILVYPQNIVTGMYNLWLPLRQFSGAEVFFLRSNPDITLTIPGNSMQPITVGGYNSANRSIYADSGRGYTLSGDIKPELVAPAVNIYGPGPNNRYMTMTGTSAAAAITAGACAQIMEWASVNQNDQTITTADVKNMLIRGANRESDRIYPCPTWGYGALDAYRAFEMLRST